jgi:hypothetical protein
MDSPINVATAAENRPVYRYTVEVGTPEGIRDKRTITHEDKDPVSICFPALSHFLILILRPVKIHGEETLRSVGEVRLSRRHMGRVGRVTIVVYS